MSHAASNTQFELAHRWVERPDPFASEGWLAHCAALSKQTACKPRSALKTLARILVRGGDFPNHFQLPYRHIREQLADRTKLRVLDIGGGFGDNYLIMRQALGSDITRLDWQAVDNEASVQLGRSLGSEAHLATDIPEQPFDLAMVIGSLQYVRDWRGLLGAVAARGAPHIYIARTPMRLKGETFLAVQPICPAYGPFAMQAIGTASVSIIAADDLAAAMRGLGYRLVRERFARDYSANFLRLPAAYRNVAYVDQMWGRPSISRPPTRVRQLPSIALDRIEKGDGGG